MTDLSGEPEASLVDIEADLDGVEQALTRLDAGDYDRCEVCGGAIATSRLAANPVGRRCDEHAPA